MSIIAAAVGETRDDVLAWGEAMWDGRESPIEPFARRLQLLLVVGAMAGASTDEMDELVGDPGNVERHAARTDMVFREMVEAIAKKRPTMSVLSPRELSEKMRQTAWYVAGVTKANVLEKIRERLIEARVKGHGQDWFMQQVSQEADLSLPRIANVFRTNVESAAGAGRWKRLNDPETSSLWFGYRYWNPRDSRSRPLHRAMHGFVAVKDDPIWRLIWTPNGFQCRCKVRPIERHEAVGKLIDDKGRQIATRWFVDDTQRAVVQSIEDGRAFIVDGATQRFPDEGFRGNAMLDLM